VRDNSIFKQSYAFFCKKQTAALNPARWFAFFTEGEKTAKQPRFAVK
jgi:hypothetical protein